MRNASFILASLLLSLAGCKRAGEHGHDHRAGSDHDHGEPKTAQITVWTNGYEIFAEHRATVVNQPMQFVTHVTDMKTFEPRREGPVTFVMQQGAQRLEHLEDKPARDGIYLPKLNFPKDGDWELALTVPGGETTAVIPLGKIEVHEDVHSAAHAEIPEPGEGISFLKEQQWKLPMATEVASRRSLVERLRVPGQVRAKPGFSADVVSPVPGQIVAGARVTMPGERVEAGQLLTYVQPRFTEATARLAEAEGEFTRTRAELANAHAILGRAEELRKEQAIPQVELEQAEVDVKRAQGNLEAATALRSMYRQSFGDPASTSGPPRIEVRAPIAGVIDRAGAGLGQAVTEGERLFTIINSEALWIEAHIPEAVADRVHEAGEGAYERVSKPGKLIEGAKRVYSGLSISPETRTVPLIYEIGKGPRIGEAVNLFVQTQRAEQTVAIPETAVVEEAGEEIAFVQVAGEMFQKRTLKLGVRDGRLVQVLEGVREGERVVTHGAFAIRLATVSGVIPAHGHAH